MTDQTPEIASPTPTIRLTDVVHQSCDHCQAPTVQIVGGTGLFDSSISRATACLQCIADGGTCCSLASLNRWKPTPEEGEDRG